MLPTLSLGPFSLPTYPLALLLAGWIALEVGARAARRLGLEGDRVIAPDHIYNAGLYGLVAGFVVARFGHVIAYWPAYRTQPSEIFGLNTRAFLLGPGIVGALVVIGWYVYRHRLPVATMLDAFAPGLLAGVAMAQVGALLDGRSLGAPTNLPWALNLWGVMRHPSQIYEALVALTVLLAIWLLLRRCTPAGMIAWVALLGYGLSRWLLEPFRAESATILGGLRTAQVLGLTAALVALMAMRARHTCRRLVRRQSGVEQPG